MIPRVVLALACALLALTLTMAAPRAALAVGPNQAHSQPQPQCPPRRAQAPHPRASDTPMRGERQGHANNCARGHVHDWLHRNFHQRQNRQQPHDRH